MRPTALLLAAPALVLALALAATGAAAEPPSGPPPGYEAVFDDGRNNPHRARRTVTGDALTGQIWTDEVPRRTAPHARLSGHGPKGAGGPPRGYAYAFEDGRLNPHRGPGTAAGAARMERIWTDTVPRRMRAGVGAGY